MSTMKLKTATVLFLVLGIGAAGLAIRSHQAIAAQQADREQHAAAEPTAKERPQPAARPAKPKANDSITVRGLVLGPDGKPFAGAKLYLNHSQPKEKGFAERATSGADGRFEFTIAKSELGKANAHNAPPQVMAAAKGHGCDWATVSADGKTGELTLRLVKDVPISGRILDPDGKPVVGAKIKVTGLSAPKGDDLGGYLEAVRKDNFQYTFAKDWAGPLPGRSTVLTTGADGRFRLAGLGRERVVHLHVAGPAIASTRLEVMTRPTKNVKGAKLDPLEGVRHAYGAAFNYVAVASRPIRGVVRDKETRKLLAGVSIGLASLGRVYFFEPQWMTVTDEEGRYELLGLAKAPEYNLAVKPAKGQLYFQREAQFGDPPGLTPLTADIDMVQWLMVHGKVTDQATGKPIAEARVTYEPVYPNANINIKMSGRWNPRSEAITGADGSYVLTVLPGPGFLGVTAPKWYEYAPPVVTPREIKDVFKAPLGLPPGWHRYYNALVLLNPDPKYRAMVKDVALERPTERKGRVVGPDGKPLTGVTVDGSGVVKGAEVIVRGLNPRAPAGRTLIFYHKGKNLGCFLKSLPAEKDDPFTVKLQPCGSASGRLVDQDGIPHAGMRCRGGLAGPAARSLDFTTDKEGRFRVEGLVPGLTYWILNPKGAGILFQFTVEPGKHKDLGDIKLNDN